MKSKKQSSMNSSEQRSLPMMVKGRRSNSRTTAVNPFAMVARTARTRRPALKVSRQDSIDKVGSKHTEATFECDHSFSSLGSDSEKSLWSTEELEMEVVTVLADYSKQKAHVGRSQCFGAGAKRKRGSARKIDATLKSTRSRTESTSLEGSLALESIFEIKDGFGTTSDGDKKNGRNTVQVKITRGGKDVCTTNLKRPALRASKSASATTSDLHQMRRTVEQAPTEESSSFMPSKYQVQPVPRRNSRTTSTAAPVSIRRGSEKAGCSAPQARRFPRNTSRCRRKNVGKRPDHPLKRSVSPRRKSSSSIQLERKKSKSPIRRTRSLGLEEGRSEKIVFKRKSNVLKRIDSSKLLQERPQVQQKRSSIFSAMMAAGDCEMSRSTSYTRLRSSLTQEEKDAINRGRSPPKRSSLSSFATLSSVSKAKATHKPRRSSSPTLVLPPRSSLSPKSPRRRSNGGSLVLPPRGLELWDTTPELSSSFSSLLASASSNDLTMTDMSDLSNPSLTDLAAAASRAKTSGNRVAAATRGSLARRCPRNRSHSMADPLAVGGTRSSRRASSRSSCGSRGAVAGSGMRSSRRASSRSSCGSRGAGDLTRRCPKRSQSFAPKGPPQAGGRALPARSISSSWSTIKNKTLDDQLAGGLALFGSRIRRTTVGPNNRRASNARMPTRPQRSQSPVPAAA